MIVRTLRYTNNSRLVFDNANLERLGELCNFLRLGLYKFVVLCLTVSLLTSGIQAEAFTAINLVAANSIV